MNGHIIPNSCIAIDTWRSKTTALEYIHFLTHIHSDHTVGLTSTWQKPIYCSEITAYLLIERYGVKEKLIQILHLNQSVVVQVSLSHQQSTTFTVTAFDANHCPGAIMLYFQGSFGNVLYTGDFRLSEDIIEMAKKLSGQVDTLYLDNTFCSPQCVFPSQDDCFEEIVDIIRKHPNHRVIIGLRKIGKETLLGRLGVTLNETITVSPESYKLCDLLFSTNVLTTANLSKKASRLSVVPMEVVTRMLSLLNKYAPTIGIIPTAIFTGCTENVMKDPNLYIVPYSDHCSYPELVQFVSTLRPSKVVPIVTGTKGPYNSDFSDRLNMSCFDAYLSQPHAVSTGTNATNQLGSHTEMEKLTGTVTNYKSPLVKRRTLGTKKKAKAKGVVYCKGFYPLHEPMDDEPSVLKDGIICEDKEAAFKLCETSGHPSIDLTAEECESFHFLNEPVTQTTYDHPSDLPHHISPRISLTDFCPDSLDYEITTSSSNSPKDSIIVIDLTSDNEDFADIYVPRGTFQINRTVDNHEQADSKSVLPEMTLDTNVAEQNTQLQGFGINTEVEEKGKTKEKTNQLVKIRRRSSKTDDSSNSSKYTKCIKNLCNACDVMPEKHDEKVTLLMDWDSNKQVKQRGRPKRKMNRLVEIPSSKVQNRESPSKESSQSSYPKSKKKCMNSEIPNILSTSISKHRPLLDVQETNTGAVYTTAGTLQQCNEKEQPLSRKEEVANPSAILHPLEPQKRGRGRPKKKDQLSNVKNSKNLVSLIQADRLNRTNTYLRKSSIGKIKRENSPDADQTKKLMSLVCSAVCSALLPLRSKRLIKDEVTHDDHVASASCLSGMSDSPQDVFKDSPEGRNWETSTPNHSLEDSDFMSASDEEYTIKKLSNQVSFNKESLHIIDSSIPVGTQDEKKISETENKKLQKQICLKDSIKKTRINDEFRKNKDTSHSSDEELGDHQCSKDRVDNRNTLSKSQAALCVNLPELSNSTSSVLTNHSVLQGKVKETYIKNYAMESSAVGPEEIRDYRSVHINNASTKQTPQMSSCLPVVRKISETICSDGDIKATLDQTSDEHSSEFTMDTMITGPGSHKSTISNKVHFCYDCFTSRFSSAAIENQVKSCFVCEKPVQKKIFCDQMFVNTLKDLFFRKDSIKS